MSLYQQFAAEGLRQGKSLEEIGRAWRSAHGARHNPAPYTPEGEKRERRSEKLVDGLHEGLSFHEALRRAEEGENPSRRTVQRELRRGYRDSRRSRDLPTQAEMDAARRLPAITPRAYRNPSWPREHWLPLATAAAVGIGVFAVASRKHALPDNTPLSQVAPSQVAPSQVSRLITAQTAVATDQGLYAGQAAAGPGVYVGGGS